VAIDREEKLERCSPGGTSCIHFFMYTAVCFLCML